MASAGQQSLGPKTALPESSRQTATSRGGSPEMTREEYGSAYKKGYNLTVRFLVSRGLSYDGAQETAQAAWVKGWERLAQLRDAQMGFTWMKSIALNIHPSCMRAQPLLPPFP